VPRLIDAHATEPPDKTSNAKLARTVERAASDEGFRLYRSAVRLLLCYRRSLEDAICEVAERQHMSFGDPNVPGQISLEQIETKPLWISPLEELCLPPSHHING
jgi:hypothetical protein